MRGKLPAYLRWEWDGQNAQVNFRCHCSPEEGQGYRATVEETGSAMHVRCRNCRQILQLRSSLELVADGGAPGSAKNGRVKT